MVGMCDTPTLMLKVARGTRHDYDLPGMAALQMPYTTVRPVIWKRALGLGKDKEACRLRAMQLFLSADLRLKKHHGWAEALLLALYGQRHLGA